MRVTVPHNKGIEGAKREVERAVERLSTVNFPGTVEFTGVEKRWEGTTMSFSLFVAIGPLRSPIRGVAFVTERDITLDIDLPKVLTAIMPERTIESRVRGLLGK